MESLRLAHLYANEVKENMKTIKLEELLKDRALRKEVIRDIKDGKIFIYPTDTVYGLGCNAFQGPSVKSIREIKNTGHPFSIIAPSKDWIKRNFHLPSPKYLDKLPGPYTLILKKKRPTFLTSSSIYFSLGVRIPDHPLTKIIQEADVPFITTSANVSGLPTIKEVNEKISARLRLGVDIAIDGGKIEGKPSQIIDLTGEKPEILRK